jgi:hypothetical protein
VADFAAIEELLRERGAQSREHPGGTLYSHLRRVRDRLARLGAEPDMRAAGLAHAVYGTDGFAVALLGTGERHILRELAGTRVERLVYRYGGCDRERTWPRLGETRRVVNRFDGSEEDLDEASLRDFVDLTVVNEVDVVEHSPEIAGRYGEYFRTLFGSWEELGSPGVMADARRTLARVGRPVQG